MNGLPQLWFLQYIMSGVLSIAISIYVLYKRPKTLTMKCFFFFGLIVSSWALAVFFQRTASDSLTSSFFFIISFTSNSLSLPTYLFIALSIREEGKKMSVIFIPMILSIIAYPFFSLNFYMTEFGWNYHVETTSLLVLVYSAVYFSYMIAIVISLFELMRRARSSILKRKYFILFASFTVFQAIGIPLTNYIVISNPVFPPIGGVLNLLTFLFIGYAITIKEEKVSLTSAFAKIDFSVVYSSFLAILYNYATDSSLGEGSFKFVDFIRESGIKENVKSSQNGVTFRGSENLNIIDLVNRNLKALEANFVGTEVVDYYLRVLNSTYSTLGDEFDKVVTLNEDFLKRSDLVYGIGKGHYLKGISQDDSLENLNDVDACLKIYKRILLLVSDFIRSSNELKKRTSMYYATKTVKVTEYGEVLIYGTEHLVSKVPKEERLAIIIESFNSLASWVYENILTNSDIDTQGILENLHLVLTLNRKKADELNVYQTFLGRLATRIPKTQIHKFYSDYLEELVESKNGELRDVQKRLLESERLAAIGETAAMVGHDL